MVFEPADIRMTLRTLKRRRPDIYQLLSTEFNTQSLDDQLPSSFPAKYFGEIFQKFISSFSEKIPLSNYDGEIEPVYIVFAFDYNARKKTFSIYGSDLQDVQFVLRAGIHSVFLNFYDEPLEQTIGTMIRLIIALQKHLELSSHTETY